MKTVNVSELEGAALDWAVAKAIGSGVLFEDWGGSEPWVILSDYEAFEWVPFAPSTDWSQGGPLIDKFRPDIGTGDQGHLTALMNNCEDDEEDLVHMRGETYLLAACRAIVASKFGSTVEVPEELL